MDELRWYRVEFSDSGKIVSIDAVSDDASGTPHVIYVIAKDEGSARKAAYWRRQKYALKERRKKYHDQGLCRCGRERDSDGLRCSRCLKKQKIYYRRSEERKNGEEVPPMSKADAYVDRMKEHANDARRAVLFELRKLLGKAKSIDDVQVWCLDELLKLQ